MAEVVITFKVMPASPDADFDVILDKSKEILSHFGTVGKTEFRPVAFGLKALIIYFITDESSGDKMEEMEKQLGEIEDVNSVEVEDVRRTLEI